MASRRTELRSNDRGQAAPLVLVVMAVALLAVWIVGRVVDDTAAAAAARTAADAAALAGAAEGPAAARTIAAANGAVLIDYRATEHHVDVVVRVGPARASARAAFTLVRVPVG